MTCGVAFYRSVTRTEREAKQLEAYGVRTTLADRNSPLIRHLPDPVADWLPRSWSRIVLRVSRDPQRRGEPLPPHAVDVIAGFDELAWIDLPDSGLTDGDVLRLVEGKRGLVRVSVAGNDLSAECLPRLKGRLPQGTNLDCPGLSTETLLAAAGDPMLPLSETLVSRLVAESGGRRVDSEEPSTGDGIVVSIFDGSRGQQLVIPPPLSPVAVELLNTLNVTVFRAHGGGTDWDTLRVTPNLLDVDRVGPSLVDHLNARGRPRTLHVTDEHADVSALANLSLDGIKHLTVVTADRSLASTVKPAGTLKWLSLRCTSEGADAVDLDLSGCGELASLQMDGVPATPRTLESLPAGPLGNLTLRRQPHLEGRQVAAAVARCRPSVLTLGHGVDIDPSVIACLARPDGPWALVLDESSLPDAADLLAAHRSGRFGLHINVEDEAGPSPGTVQSFAALLPSYWHAGQRL